MLSGLAKTEDVEESMFDATRDKDAATCINNASTSVTVVGQWPQAATRALREVEEHWPFLTTNPTSGGYGCSNEKYL